jgi:hypothetical protein
MIPVAENPVIVPDHELEEEKKLGESEPPRIRCPTVRLVACQGRQMVLHLRQRVEQQSLKKVPQAHAEPRSPAFEAAIYDSIVTAERILQRIDDRLYIVPQPWP